MLKECIENVRKNVPLVHNITKDNIKDLANSGICGIAVISAIFAQKDIEAATKELKEKTIAAVK